MPKNWLGEYGSFKGIALILLHFNILTEQQTVEFISFKETGLITDELSLFYLVSRNLRFETWWTWLPQLRTLAITELRTLARHQP